MKNVGNDKGLNPRLKACIQLNRLSIDQLPPDLTRYPWRVNRQHLKIGK